MGKVGKISTIKKQFSKGTGSLQAALAENGYSRFPGSCIRISPYYDQLAGKYLTGLDPKASYLADLTEKDKEIKILEINALREKLEEKTGLKLHPTSDYYNVNSEALTKTHMYKLVEGDNIFNLENSLERIAWEWIKQHPMVAPSMEAYERGEVLSTVQFFVNDEDVEADKDFKKKISVNKAIAILETLPVEKQRKLARVLDLPVTDDTKPMIVYNQLDTKIKEGEIKSGKYKNENFVELFIKISGLDDRLLTTKDIVQQSIKYGILREKNGKIFDGENMISKSEIEFVTDLLDDDNQDQLITLKEQLRQKKIIN